MLGRLIGAVSRGFLVACLISMPALMLPSVVVDSGQITVLVALLAALLTCIEYNSSAPSLVEFRDAPPFNRLRFAGLFVTVFALSGIMKGQMEPTVLTGMLTSVGTILGNAMDFPFSPVRLAVLMLPETADQRLVQTVRSVAGLAYAVSVITLLIFLVQVRFLGWPTRKGAFNVWINLPIFDPTAGGDVVYRLQRDARVNIAIGFLLPFLIPALVKATASLIDPNTLQNPQTLIWTISAWAFLPASMIMRGIAMGRIANLVQYKRRRAYADAHAEGDYQTA